MCKKKTGHSAEKTELDSGVSLTAARLHSESVLFMSEKSVF